MAYTERISIRVYVARCVQASWHTVDNTLMAINIYHYRSKGESLAMATIRKQPRPDSTFMVTVCPVYRVHSCQAKLDQESRGLMGFHSFTTCPDCKLTSEGWEMWGENGHKQASAPSRERLIHWVSIKAKEQWKMRAGGIMGYRFQQGSPMYYRGN